jgi:hypothetical protein
MPKGEMLLIIAFKSLIISDLNLNRKLINLNMEGRGFTQ